MQSSAVLKHLQHYIRVEEKDRLHSLNHFTHVKKTSPEEAKLIQGQVMEHMKVIDERIKQSLDMLHHFPKVEAKLKTALGTAYNLLLEGYFIYAISVQDLLYKVMFR